jgi:hypothetical protein
MRMLGTSSCSAVVAAVASGLTAPVDGVELPTGTAWTAVFLVATAAATTAAIIAARTPSKANVLTPA